MRKPWLIPALQREETDSKLLVQGHSAEDSVQT